MTRTRHGSGDGGGIDSGKEGTTTCFDGFEGSRHEAAQDEPKVAHRKRQRLFLRTDRMKRITIARGADRTVTPTLPFPSPTSNASCAARSASPSPSFPDNEEDAQGEASTNTDVLAVRAALDILRLQRQQALSDLRTLERYKASADCQPRAFAEALKSGEIRSRSPGLLGAAPLYRESVAHKERDDDSEAQSIPQEPLPTAQDIVRCPSVNWAKYHILGQPLDTLHVQQQNNPLGGQPYASGHEFASWPEDVSQILKSELRKGGLPVAAPYDPWQDASR